MYRKPSEKFLFAPEKAFSLNPEESDAEKPPGSPLQEGKLLIFFVSEKIVSLLLIALELTTMDRLRGNIM